jgi:hypothetical protein
LAKDPIHRQACSQKGWNGTTVVPVQKAKIERALEQAYDNDLLFSTQKVVSRLMCWAVKNKRQRREWVPQLKVQSAANRVFLEIKIKPSKVSESSIELMTRDPLTFLNQSKGVESLKELKWLVGHAPAKCLVLSIINEINHTHECTVIDPDAFSLLEESLFEGSEGSEESGPISDGMLEEDFDQAALDQTLALIESDASALKAFEEALYPALKQPKAEERAEK